MNLAEAIETRLRAVLPAIRTQRHLDRNTASGARLDHTGKPRFSVDLSDTGDAYRLLVGLPQLDEAITEVMLEKAAPGALEPARFQALITDTVADIVDDTYRNALQHVKSANETLLSSLDPADIVRHVVEAAINMMPEGDAGVFRIYDSEQDMLIAVSQIGFDNEYLYHRYQRNESIAGAVFETRTPILLRTQNEVFTHRSNMTPENLSYLRKSRIARSLICVPVMIDGRCLGTLTLLNFRDEAAFSPFGISMLGLFATHVAIAWKNAQTHRQALDSLQLYKDLRAELETKNQQLSDAVTIYSDLFAAFTRLGSLDSKLSSVSERFGFRFRYLDLLGNSFLSTDMGSCGAAASEAAEDFIRSGEPPAKRDGVLTMPVRISNVNFGMLIALDGAIDEIDRIRLEILTSFIALEIRKELSAEDFSNTKKTYIFDRLTAGNDPDIANILKQNRFFLRRYCKIIVIRYSADTLREGRDIFLQKKKARLFEKFAWANSFSFYNENEIVVILSSDSKESIREAVSGLASWLEREGAHGGASQVYENEMSHAAQYDNAVQGAALLADTGKSGLQSYDRIGIERLLVNQPRAHIVKFVHDVLSPLSHRGGKGSALFETLASYVANGKAVAETARALRIHPNTLYQRLSRIEELTGYRCADAEDFMILSLACHLRSIYEVDPDLRHQRASAVKGIR